MCMNHPETTSSHLWKIYLPWNQPLVPERLGTTSLGDSFGNLDTKMKWKVKVKVTWSCLTLWDPMVYTVHGILQARILEWVAYPFSSGSSWPRNWTRVSCIAGGFFTNWAITRRLWRKKKKKKQDSACKELALLQGTRQRKLIEPA